MVSITFIEARGDEYEVEAEIGRSLMEAGVKNGVRGIAADCGGGCACATCRIYVDASWQVRIGPPGEMEQVMLNFCSDTESGARLSCQIPVTEELAGMIVRLPAEQQWSR